MSARDWRAVREGEAHAAVKTSINNTPESLIVGVGASGALLAGAAIVFVTLVGLVSFNVWPASGVGPGIRAVELGGAATQAVTPPGTAAATPAAPATTGAAVPARSGRVQAGGNSRGVGKREGSKRTTPAPTPVQVTPATPPSVRGPRGGSGNADRPGRGNGNRPSTNGKRGASPGQARNSAPGRSGHSGGNGNGGANRPKSSDAPTSTATASRGNGHNPGNGNGRSGK